MSAASSKRYYEKKKDDEEFKEKNKERAKERRKQKKLEYQLLQDDYDKQLALTEKHKKKVKALKAKIDDLNQRNNALEVEVRLLSGLIQQQGMYKLSFNFHNFRRIKCLFFQKRNLHCLNYVVPRR